MQDRPGTTCRWDRGRRRGLVPNRRPAGPVELKGGGRREGAGHPGHSRDADRPSGGRGLPAGSSRRAVRVHHALATQRRGGLGRGGRLGHARQRSLPGHGSRGTVGEALLAWMAAPGAATASLGAAGCTGPRVGASGASGSGADVGPAVVATTVEVVGSTLAAAGAVLASGALDAPQGPRTVTRGLRGARSAVKRTSEAVCARGLPVRARGGPGEDQRTSAGSWWWLRTASWGTTGSFRRADTRRTTAWSRRQSGYRSGPVTLRPRLPTGLPVRQ